MAQQDREGGDGAVFCQRVNIAMLYFFSPSKELPSKGFQLILTVFHILHSTTQRTVIPAPQRPPSTLYPGGSWNRHRALQKLLGTEAI